MTIPLPPGSPAAALCGPDDHPGAPQHHVERDARTARLPLSPLLRDGAAMATLRARWLRVSGDLNLSRLDDQQLLDLVGGSLATGRLRLCTGQAAPAAAGPEVDGERQATGKPKTLAGAPPAPPPVSAATPAATAAPAAAPEPAPAPEESPEIDVAAMVAALLLAASTGVPFCEECAKAALAKQVAKPPASPPPAAPAPALRTPAPAPAPAVAETAPPPSDWVPSPMPPDNPDLDGAAMAAVLQAAASEGVPFCAECEKARRQRETESA